MTGSGCALQSLAGDSLALIPRLRSSGMRSRDGSSVHESADGMNPWCPRSLIFCPLMTECVVWPILFNEEERKVAGCDPSQSERVLSFSHRVVLTLLLLFTRKRWALCSFVPAGPRLQPQYSCCCPRFLPDTKIHCEH